MHGQIIKAINGFYYVKTVEGIIECKAKGKFRLDGIMPLVGDHVVVEKEDDGYDVISQIEKRKNEIVRPRVSNIDMLLIVLSAKTPKPDFMLIDKLIIEAKRNDIEPVLCINKCDIAKVDLLEDIKSQYADYDMLEISVMTKQGIDNLKEKIHGKTSCLAGQSAVGKTSILNILCDIERETGTTSKKTERGKHTTREVNLLPIDENSLIIDTPGFSILNIEDILPEELMQYYDEFEPYAVNCYYKMCMHHKEPDCSVKDAVMQGNINDTRYGRYIMLLEELIEKEKRKYD